MYTQIRLFNYSAICVHILIYLIDRLKVEELEVSEHMLKARFHQFLTTVQIQRRINKLDIKINEHLGNDIVIALDGPGIKITNRGEWLPHKWNVRKGYLKIHVVISISRKRRLYRLKLQVKKYMMVAG